MLLFKNKECCGGVLFFLLSLFVLYETSTFEVTLERYRGIGPAEVPNILAGALLVLSVLLFISGVRKASFDWRQALTGNRDKIRRAAALGGLMILLAVVHEPLGFVPACFLFTMAGQYVMGARTIRTMLLVATLLTAGVYAGFVLGLKVSLPSGVLEPFLPA